MQDAYIKIKSLLILGLSFFHWHLTSWFLLNLLIFYMLIFHLINMLIFHIIFYVKVFRGFDSVNTMVCTFVFDALCEKIDKFDQFQ